MDEGEETNFLEKVNATNVIVTEARSRDNETSEIGKAMAELEEWTEKKVEAISALADAIRTEWESGAAPSSLGTKAGPRKRARVADGSSSESMVMHLASLSAHAEAIREKVRGVGRSVRGLEVRKGQGGRMEGGDERGENRETQIGEEDGKEDPAKEEKEEEAGEGEKEAQEEEEEEEEGDEEGGMRDEEEEKTIDLKPLAAENGGGQDKGAGLGDEARDIVQGEGEGVVGRAGGEQSAAGEADEPVGNDLVASVERWARRAGLCGAGAAAAAAGQPSPSKGVARGEVQSALVEGKPTNGDEAFKTRLQEEIDALLLQIPPDKQQIPKLLINTTVSPRVMLSLVHLPSLTSLSFLQTPIYPAALSLIQPFSRLHQLVLDCPGPLTLAFKSGPWPLKNLKVLHLSRVTNAVLEQVGVLTSLEVLSCTSCEGVSSMGWISLDRLKRLRWLRVAPADLDGHDLRMEYPKGSLPVVSRVYARPQKKREGVFQETSGQEGVHEGAHLKHSKELPRQADDSGVWCLMWGLQRLEHLELHAPPRYGNAFISLNKLYLLTSLHITGAYIDHAAFKWLTHVTWLTHLSLAGCTFPTETVIHPHWSIPFIVVKKIADAMPKLQSLDLSGTAVTKVDIIKLQYLRHLERVTLQQCCNLGQSFVRYLSFVPQLKEVDLSFNNMPADWLRHVVEGKRVRRLRVRGCGYKNKTVRGLERPWLVIES
ncbi:unnamed protein product [Closterium sp. Naga37s-1]|nr:unnamed protein product [Closterium sp. Naga37s-1]